MTRTLGLRAVRFAASTSGQTAFFRQLGLRLRAWKARYATCAVLNTLDDRTLRDIGLRRGEIKSVSREIGQLRLVARQIDLGTMRRQMLQRRGRRS